LNKRIRQAGLSPVCVPAFNFEPASPGLNFNTIWPGDRRCLAIFSSPRAVEFGLRQLPAGFLDDAGIAAVGPATAGALEDAGFVDLVIPASEYSSEGLLSHSALGGKPGFALIFAAAGGRQKLSNELQARGWETRFAYVYRAVPLLPPPEAIAELAGARKLISVWTSANALQQVSETLGPEAWAAVCKGIFVVTSERLKAKAAVYEPQDVYVTDGPGNDAIMECILQLI
jgi:uroporphyrinogen-III synthase